MNGVALTTIFCCQNPDHYRQKNLNHHDGAKGVVAWKSVSKRIDGYFKGLARA
jgi:hypothetical protein